MVTIMEKNPKFTVLFEKLRGKSFEIDQEVMSIGRKDSADITIADGSVSSHHADIIRSEQDGKITFILRDNDSTNGTKVNNEPITEKVLKNSDLITFGHVEVLFDGVPGTADEQHVTHTIDLGSTVTNTATTQTLSNFSARMMQEKKKHEQTNMMMKIIIGVCALMVLVFVFLTISQMFSK